MRRIVVLTLAITVMLVLPVPAAATPPSDVRFEVETSLIGENPPAPFTASGPAVDDGLVCESGIVVNASSKMVGFSSNGLNFQGIKHFTCDDGTGEFFVNLQARIFFHFTPIAPIKFQWNVVGGTGAYESLRGAGRGVGIGDEPCGTMDCVLDVYDGGLHINP